MTDKELKRLSRLELLELLVVQGRELDQLQQQLDEATAVLEDRRIKQANVGSIAEAALSLNLGDPVRVTDMDGNVFSYEVAEMNTIQPTAIEEVTDSDYPLVLCTCTYGGKSRFVVYCDAVQSPDNLFA